MATVITRTIASTPKRTATETWKVIVSLLAPDQKSAARLELEKVAGVAASSIASEAPRDDGFIVYGNGPQVRVYCVFGEDAASGDGVDEDSFQEAPAGGDWRMSMPCLSEDLEWTVKKLRDISFRVTARAIGENVTTAQPQTAGASAELAVDLKEFLKP